jgi:predicted dehydrogenase
MDGYYKVHGSKGVIELSPAFGYDGIHLRAQIAKADDIDMPTPLKDPQQFTLEGDYFADCIFNDKPVKMSGQEGLRDMELMMRIYRAAGVKTA